MKRQTTARTKRAGRGGFTLVELPAVSRRGARGFTLVELLVVIAIILLLISILAPQLSKVRERGRRIQCLSHVRNLVHTVTVMASDNSRQQLPTLHYPGGPPFQYAGTARDEMLKNYDMVRDQFYCPDNASWNHDGNWSGNVSNWGYLYSVDDGQLSWSYVGTKTGDPQLPSKLTDIPSERTIWCDVTRRYRGHWGDYGNVPRGANHYSPSRDEPTGGNEGFLDGHAEWISFENMERKLSNGSIELWY